MNTRPPERGGERAQPRGLRRSRPKGRSVTTARLTTGCSPPAEGGARPARARTPGRGFCSSEMSGGMGWTDRRGGGESTGRRRSPPPRRSARSRPSRTTAATRNAGGGPGEASQPLLLLLGAVHHRAEQGGVRTRTGSWRTSRGRETAASPGPNRETEHAACGSSTAASFAIAMRLGASGTVAIVVT